MGKKLGAALIAIGALLIIAGITLGLVIQFVIVPNGFLNYLKYERDPSYDDLSFETCENETFNGFLFNMTNVADVKNGVAPIYEQVGPFNYTRRACEYNETADDTHRYYRKYWHPYYLTNGDEISEDVVIHNFNPAYMGIMNQIAQQTDSDLEFALLTNFIGPALTQVIEGLQGGFVDKVKLSGIPSVLGTIKSQTPLFRLLLREGVALQKLDGILEDDEDLLFGDSTTFEDSLSNHGVDLSELDLDLDVLLHNTNDSDGHPLGLLVPGGFLGVLKHYKDEEDPADYGLDGPEYGGLVTWVNDVILGTFVDMSDEDLFFGQWANVTVKPGLPIPGLSPGAFEVSSTASNISLESARLLWNESDSYSFANPSGSGVFAWLKAGQDAEGGNTTSLQMLGVHFELEGNETPIVLRWVGTWFGATVVPFLEDRFNVTSLDQLAWLQWGSGGVLPNNESVADHDPSIPVAPEFAIFALSGGLTFDVEFSEQLLNGSFGLMQGSYAAEFLGLVFAGDFPVINTTWGLEKEPALAVAGYLQYFLGAFIEEALFKGQLLPAGGGAITHRSAREWFFEAQDPLLARMGMSPNVGIFDTSSDPSTREAAELLPLLNETIWNGGSKDELYDFLQKKTHNGLTTVPEYNDIPVEGNAKGENFVPGLDENEPLVIWSASLVRTTVWEKIEEFDLKGITVWRYAIVPDFWESQDDNPSRADFFQEEAGVLNLTAVNPFPSFITRPHFFGVGSNFSSAEFVETTDMDYFSNFELIVEPESGITFGKKLLPQVVFGVPELNHFDTIQAGNYPILWQDDAAVLTDEDADEFKSTLNQAFVLQIVSFVVGIGLGLILVVIGVIVFRRRPSGGSDDSDGDLSLESLE